ncbi:MAG TPA: universal stress protein, partial [Bryobacteraceae bacterium]|nr:universal stress protein [Bryobacteraceae bacterium]
RVLLALDGSVASVRALNAVRSLDLHAAEIALIYVAETSWIDVGMERECISCGDRVRDSVAPEIAWDKQVRAHGQRVLGSAREQFVKSYPGVRTQLAEGIPSSEILREAATRDCDLIVLGATGATDLKHELLGSTAHRTAWDANCSVLVVRPTSVRMRETAPEGREMAHARG